MLRQRLKQTPQFLSTRPSQQRGVALLMVLLVIALVTVLAVSLSGRSHSAVQRTINLTAAEQAYWYWLSSEDIARELLQTELSDNNGVAHLQQMWALQSAGDGMVFPVEGGAIQGKIKDLHSCFNLNSLAFGANEDDALLLRRKAQLRQLLLAVVDDIDTYTADVIVDSVADWLDEDSDIGGSYGSESVDYLSLPFPYNAANAYFAHVSELRLIRGVSATIYQQIRPYVCVLPRDNSLRINVNTVSREQPELLEAVTLGAMNRADAASFLATRRQDGYDSLDDARNHGALSDAAGRELDPNLGGPLDDLDVTSKYFQINATIGVGDFTLPVESQLLITRSATAVIYRGLGEP